LEYAVISSLALVAATVIAFGEDAGEELHESSFSLPAAVTTLTP